MLYRILKIPAQLCFWIYCRNLKINQNVALKGIGPLIIASNHPNSFLDAIIISSIFKCPVYSLTRGDVFRNKFIGRLLRSMKMLPVYRTSEGVENLEHNYTTFDECKSIFKKNGIVLIFSEGSCINEWRLRPMKKGTARLALSSWEDDIDLKVLPCGINYQSFTSFGKNIQINFGKIISNNDIDLKQGYGKSIQSFNQILEQELKHLVVEIDKKDNQKITEIFAVPITTWKKILLFIPAVLGYIFHWPLYIPIKKITKEKASHNDHYDSVMVGLLFILYPFYLLLISIIVSVVYSGIWGILTLLALPLFAKSFVQLKKQF